MAAWRRGFETRVTFFLHPPPQSCASTGGRCTSTLATWTRPRALRARACACVRVDTTLAPSSGALRLTLPHRPQVLRQRDRLREPTSGAAYRGLERVYSSWRAVRRRSALLDARNHHVRAAVAAHQLGGCEHLPRGRHDAVAPGAAPRGAAAARAAPQGLRARHVQRVAGRHGCGQRGLPAGDADVSAGKSGGFTRRFVSLRSIRLTRSPARWSTQSLATPRAAIRTPRRSACTSTSLTCVQRTIDDSEGRA